MIQLEVCHLFSFIGDSIWDDSLDIWVFRNVKISIPTHALQKKKLVFSAENDVFQCYHFEKNFQFFCTCAKKFEGKKNVKLLSEWIVNEIFLAILNRKQL